jgi:hypothetical protein
VSGFDGNDYRKRVLAAIEARGGVQTSDPFEYYDLPLQDLRDSVVAEQVDSVWAFWQKQRDSPKYRGLVTALLEVHREMAPRVLARETRRLLAEQARQFRAERDTDRFAELDGAVERLVERFGGIPSGKVEGLRRFAAEAGLDPAVVEARLRAVPVVQTRSAPTAEAVPVEVRRQVRADLDELGRLLGTPPPVTLYDLLGLPPGAPREQIARERELAMARNRELRPDRRRALVDDLLSAVSRLLLDGSSDAYLDAVAEDVTAQLRPRVAAAVLVEDVLTADDLEHLTSEAEAAGLDADRADRVLAALASEAGVPLPAGWRRTASSPPPAGRARPVSGRQVPPPSRPPAPDRQRRAATSPELSADLSAARAALRSGRVLEAQRLVAQAQRQAGEALPAIRAVADEVASVLAEARQQWRAVDQALGARRFSEAATALDRLVHIAVDVPGPAGRTVESALQDARAGLERAGEQLAAAEGLPPTAREAALLRAVADFPDHEGLLAAVRALSVQPPADVRVERTSGGVAVRWRPSPTAGVEYRVLRVAEDGSRRPLGTTRGLELEDGEPAAGGAPTYVVVARRAGVLSSEVHASVGGPGASAGAVAAAPLLPVVEHLAAAALGRRVRLVFPPPGEGLAEVRRLPDGTAAPPPGTAVPEVEALGALVPAMGPGLAVDRRQGTPATYLVLTVGGGSAVAGAATTVADLAPVSSVRADAGALLWDWPPGCTEALVVWRADAPPGGPHDPEAQRRKVTNTRYDLDEGAPLPAGRPLHVAVFPCTRHRSELVVGLDAPAGARLTLPGGDTGERAEPPLG